MIAEHGLEAPSFKMSLPGTKSPYKKQECVYISPIWA